MIEEEEEEEEEEVCICIYACMHNNLLKKFFQYQTFIIYTLIILTLCAYMRIYAHNKQNLTFYIR